MLVNRLAGQGAPAGAGEPADTLAAVTILPTPPVWLGLVKRLAPGRCEVDAAWSRGRDAASGHQR